MKQLFLKFKIKKELLSKLAFPIGLIFFILLGFLGGWWDELFSEKKQNISRQPPTAAIMMQKIKVIFWNELEKKWQMRAAKLWQENNSLQVNLEKITKTEVYSIKDEKFDFTAGFAKLESFRNLLTFGGGVQIKMNQGVFNSEKATMDYKGEEITFDQKVNYQGIDYMLEAGGMKFKVPKETGNNQPTEKIVYFKNNVKLLSPEATIEALSLDYNLDADTAVFYNNVVMNRNVIADEANNTSEPFTLTTKQLYFENKTKNFEAKGESKIVHQEFNGEAENMKYTQLNQELVMNEKVHIRRKVGEEITGNTLKIDLEERDFVMQENVNIDLELED